MPCEALLDLDPALGDEWLWMLPPTDVFADAAGVVHAEVAFRADSHQEDRPPLKRTLRFRAYGGVVVRVSLDGAGSGDPGARTSLMLASDDALAPEALTVRQRATTWEAIDAQGRVRVRVATDPGPVRHWQTGFLPGFRPWCAITVWPDGHTEVPFVPCDTFWVPLTTAHQLSLVAREGQPRAVQFSLAAEHDERFAGTGERFATMDLKGRTIVLENDDALGANNRRCYKNVPFWWSSRGSSTPGYGVFLHTPCHARVSFADLSTRAVLASVEEPDLDLFLIGAGAGTAIAQVPERLLFHYRQLSGFPPPIPRWSLGMWMSRMTYFSADEVEGIAQRLRDEQFPCDVLHLDTGWFQYDWKCDWTFSRERFPDPAGFIARLRSAGFRISLWQWPRVAAGIPLQAEARALEVVIPQRGGADGRASEMGQSGEADIDFRKPHAVAWYQGKLQPLLALGVSAIKTDFGETLKPDNDYGDSSLTREHNLYALRYQQAAWEACRRHSRDAILWARGGWAGAQRYAVHWAGDTSTDFPGLIGCLRGGMHLGASGFGCWSMDTPGFHGLPDFMGHWPSETVYLRWTQAAIFASHIRYHGTTPREPWNYPGVAHHVRTWLRLRYGLIPYLEDAIAETTRSGWPVLRALALHWPDEARAWQADDQFLCGGDILVAPVANDAGVRDVWVPPGAWVDAWDGQVHHGPVELHRVASPLARIPVFFRQGAHLRTYPHVVQHTGEMADARIETLVIDGAFRGLKQTALGRMAGVGEP